jgi:hypothetical protein
MKLGKIYKASWDDSIMRVIGFDEFEVFYDGYCEHDDSWTFASNLKKKCSFYRTSRNIFSEKASLIDFKELTKEENDIFRPDLTIRTCRVENASWLDSDFNIERTDMKSIKSEKVWLYPFGPKGGLKKGELITAKNNKEFTIPELLKSAKRIQQSVNINKTNGIGIYRIGIQKQLPSYYIGEFIDLAGIMKLKEKA